MRQRAGDLVILHVVWCSYRNSHTSVHTSNTRNKIIQIFKMCRTCLGSDGGFGGEEASPVRGRAGKAKVVEEKKQKQEKAAPAARKKAARRAVDDDDDYADSEDEIVFEPSASRKRRRVEEPAFKDSGIGPSILEADEDVEDDDEESIGGVSIEEESEAEADDSGIFDDGFAAPEDDPDEDPDYVDIEADELAGYASSEGSEDEYGESTADEADEAEASTADDEEADSPPARNLRSAKKRRATTTPRRIAQIKKGKKVSIYDPDCYKYLRLGSEQYAEWFLDMDPVEVEEKIREGRKAWEGYFSDVKEEAAGWPYRPYKPECPFKQNVLAVFQSEAWTPSRLADIVLSGMCRYRKYLQGLGRPPTLKEHIAIPRPSPKQMRQMGVYGNLVWDRLTEVQYRYIGSGTARLGVAKRWRSYEYSISKIWKEYVKGRSDAVPRMRPPTHTKATLQPYGQSYMRMRANFDHGRLSPTMVVVVEGALVDFERTMSNDVPDADSMDSWAAIHSEAMRDASWARFSRRRTMPADMRFVGVNRASPYKQGAHTGVRGHRLRQWQEHDKVCSCCLRKLRGGEEGIRKNTRLAQEVSMPLEEITTMCSQCVKLWEEQPERGEANARYVVARRRRPLPAGGATKGCGICALPLSSGYGNNAGYWDCDIPGFEGLPGCDACCAAWTSQLEGFGNEAPGDAAVLEFVTTRLEQAAAEAGGSRADDLNRAAGACVSCGNDISKAGNSSRPCRQLPEFPRGRWCNQCRQDYGIHQRAAKKQGKPWGVKESRGWHEARWAAKQQQDAKKKQLAANKLVGCRHCGMDRAKMPTTGKKAKANRSILPLTKGEGLCYECYQSEHNWLSKLKKKTPTKAQQLEHMEKRKAFRQQEDAKEASGAPPREKQKQCRCCKNSFNGEKSRFSRLKIQVGWCICMKCYTAMQSGFRRLKGASPTEAQEREILADVRANSS